jgi:hypothetical protein
MHATRNRIGLIMQFRLASAGTDGKLDLNAASFVQSATAVARDRAVSVTYRMVGREPPIGIEYDCSV